MPHTPFATLLLVIATAVCLGGCGDGASGETGSPATPPKKSPTVSGSPPTVALQGRTYAFRPTATSATGGALTFSIRNRPPWTSFEPSTGRLSGTPAASDVGVFGGVVIEASDGTATGSLGPFSIDVTAVANGAATLLWLPPTHNTDGSPLEDLVGYRIYFGTQHADYPNVIALDNPGLATYIVDQLTPATWFFAMSSVNRSGIESALSNAAMKSVP